MPNLTTTQWLLVGLVAILLILLAFYDRRRQHHARMYENRYRTANGRDIDSQTLAIQRQPMATNRRVRAGAWQSRCTGKCRQGRNCTCEVDNFLPVPTPHSMPSALHLVSSQRKHHPGYGPANQASIRGTAAALYDRAHGGKRQASPYTVGSVEHADFMAAYDLAYKPKPGTVQTSAQSAEAPAAA